MTEHTIYLIGGDDEECGVLTTDRNGETCTLSFLVRGRRLDASAEDFFAALCQIRRQLEPESLIPFCYGASLNVYPSGMSRQMSGGTVAYRLTIGKHGSDSVNIFKAGPDIIPASVDAQKSFYADWAASLGA